MKNKLPVIVAVVVAAFVLIPLGIFAYNNLSSNNVANNINATPTPDTRCIVTISGVKYAIDELLETHTGGAKMLKCGEDLTETYFKRHDQALLDGDMTKYKI